MVSGLAEVLGAQGGGLFGEDGLGPFAFAGGDVGGDAIEESVEFADMVAAEPAGGQVGGGGREARG